MYDRTAALILYCYLINLPEILHSGRHILKEKICKGNSRHGFHDNDCAGNDNRIMAAEHFHRKC